MRCINWAIQSISSNEKVALSNAGNAWNLNAAEDAIMVNPAFAIQSQKEECFC
jgi:hypothetical protein